jgi:MSHA biogenesis protein MshK
MNGYMTGSISKLLALGAALAVAAPLAAAQALRDPTRPPSIFGRSGNGAIMSRSRDAEWVLQSVLLSPERRYAIINGEVLTLGGSVAGAELVAIREGEVTLRAAGGLLRTVRLFPDVDMRSGAVPQARLPKHDAAGPGAKARPGSATADDAAR